MGSRAYRVTWGYVGLKRQKTENQAHIGNIGLYRKCNLLMPRAYEPSICGIFRSMDLASL